MEAEDLCRRVEDIEGNCNVDGEKGCMKFLTNKYNKICVVANVTTFSCCIRPNVFANVNIAAEKEDENISLLIIIYEKKLWEFVVLTWLTNKLCLV